MSTFLPYGRQYITDEDVDAVVKVLKSSFLTQGPKVSEFEDVIRSIVQAQHAIAVNSATSALHVACLALDLGPKEILWTTPITFVASANCALYCGAEVDFVDVEPDTGLMCTICLEEKLKAAKKLNKLPKVVVPVHLTGTSCDMKKIYQLSVEYGFSIIEDASHAIGGSYYGEPVGSCKYSHICVFSFHPVKIITTGEGGAATTNSVKLADKMRRLRSHGITKDPSQFLQTDPPPWVYEQQDLGFNYRMTDFQAALGISQLRQLSENIKTRNKKLFFYRKLISDWQLPLTLTKIPSNTVSAVHLAIVQLQGNLKAKRRFIFERLREQQIGVQVHYMPVHLQPYYQQQGFVAGQYPKAEEFADGIISIPLFPQLSDQDQIRVVNAIKQLL